MLSCFSYVRVIIGEIYILFSFMHGTYGAQMHILSFYKIAIKKIGVLDSSTLTCLHVHCTCWISAEKLHCCQPIDGEVSSGWIKLAVAQNIYNNFWRAPLQVNWSAIFAQEPNHSISSTWKSQKRSFKIETRVPSLPTVAFAMGHT